MSEQYNSPRTERWAMIINPTAGKLRNHKKWNEIFRKLSRAEISYSKYYTDYEGHAVVLARHLVETRGFRHIVVAGGDGTLHEVVNGIMSSDIPDKREITLALMPYGTGNDWGRYWGIYRGKTDIVKILYNRKTVRFDVGTLSYVKSDGEKVVEYFTNSIGMGVDAWVVYYTNILKKHFGGHSWLYSLSLLASVFFHKMQNVELIPDDASQYYKGPLFTANIGNSCYSGGGLKQTDGDPTDGLMFGTFITSVNVIKILKGLKALFAKRMWDIPIAHVVKDSHLHIHTERPQLFEANGVLIDLRKELDTLDFDIDIHHHALNMLVP